MEISYKKNTSDLEQYIVYTPCFFLNGVIRKDTPKLKIVFILGRGTSENSTYIPGQRCPTF